MSDPTASPRSLQAALAPLGNIHGADGPEVTGITADSREVQPGYVFVAVPGTDEDGHAFVDQAVSRGAVAVVAEREIGVESVPVLRVANARRALAELAAAWYGHPATDLTLVGITGSLGKTSVLTMLEAVLAEAGVRTGAIGSEIVGIRVQDQLDLDTPNTTPGPTTLHYGLRRARDEGAEVVCMEVSSHGIDQERVHGLGFAVGVFSNLVQLEHQDYHGSFEEYVRTKVRFCDHLEPSAPLIYGIDSPRLRSALSDRENPLVGCGFDDQADVRIASSEATAEGTTYQLEVRAPLQRHDGTMLDPCSLSLGLRLLGRPHVLNSAFAATAALCLGVDGEAIQRALAAFPPPERRMQLLTFDDGRGGFQVLDDTAGHPDSIDAVFDVVDQLPHRRLHVVAAIRGQRGPKINSRLATALAQRYGTHPFDTFIVTDSADTVDEPDEVTPEEREAFLAGVHQPGTHVEHTERLEEALSMISEDLGAGDLLVLVGAQGMRAGTEILRDRMGASLP